MRDKDKATQVEPEWYKVWKQ